MRLVKFLGLLAVVLLLLGGLGAVGLVTALAHFGRDLPDYQQLADYDPPVTTRVHAGDGRLIAEYARERRLYVPVSAMPERVIKAFLAAEDKNFYQHPGVDFTSVIRAAVTNLANFGLNRRPVGASTITQQVAKNFLLSNEVSVQRKIKEAILAFRIERAFSKDRILELYLNEIYLGFGGYGVAAAALNYFDKSLDDLTIAEAAYLAALPKAPNNYHPQRFPDRAKARRDWVIDRMADEGFVSVAEADAARAEPLKVRLRQEIEVTRAEWFSEEVRREVADRFGERALYEGGLSVRTSLDPRLQELGESVLRAGLVAYDRRHGWRGPIARLPLGPEWAVQLAQVPVPAGLAPWTLAVVLDVQGQSAHIGFAGGGRGHVPFAELSWARAWHKDQELGPPVRQPKDVLQPGDVIAVEEAPRSGRDAFALRQIPEIGGGLVAMDPHTGRVLALVGGWDFDASQFNRATQATRQPGSAFKPFIYAAALDKGFTPSSLILDAPFVLEQGPGLGKWKPGNYSGEFYGPSTLRVGLEKSRNLMTVRLAQSIGMDVVVDYAKRFGIVDNMPPSLAMSLGAGETTLLRLTAAYAELVNGGKRVVPSLIDRVQDRRGRTVFRHDDRPCPECRGTVWQEQPLPSLPDDREPVLDPVTAYQIVSMLQGVVDRGTAVRVRELGRPLGGKTGTTNDFFDAWFVGFSPDLTVGIYTGFDTPRTLGDKESGSSVAVPIFKDFMAEALRGTPVIPFRVPPGVRLVRVDAATGLPARPGDRNVILEAFRPGTEPSFERTVLDGSDEQGGGDVGYAAPAAAPGTAAPAVGTGGLY